jgi:hypothetical protein
MQYPLSVIGAKTVTIRRLIRRMRGGSQSWLVEGEDDQYYVVKFRGNPQGNRTLVNELYVYPLLSDLNILTPPLYFIDLPEHLAQAEELYFLAGNRRTRPQGRLHLGSQCPANPETTVIFDSLPDRLLPKISNLADFATMLVVSIWCYRSDSLQAVFIRQRSVVPTQYLAYIIDHGMFFDGFHWDLRDAPRGLGLYKQVCSEIDIRTLTKDAASKVQAISEATLLAYAQAIPPAWFGPGERQLFGRLIDSLRKRQRTLPHMVTRHLDYLGF